MTWCPQDFRKTRLSGRKYIQIAFVPQMLMWIVFTIIVGSLFGSVAVAVARRSSKQKQQTA